MNKSALKLRTTRCLPFVPREMPKGERGFDYGMKGNPCRAEKMAIRISPMVQAST